MLIFCACPGRRLCYARCLTSRASHHGHAGVHVCAAGGDARLHRHVLRVRARSGALCWNGADGCHSWLLAVSGFCVRRTTPPAGRALTRCTGLPHAPEHPAPLALARRHVRARAARARRVVVRRRRGRDRRVHDAHRVRRRGGRVWRAGRVVRDGEHDGLVARAARRAVRAREPEQIQYWGIQGVTGVQEDRVSVSGRAFVCAPARLGA
jgi:hypothetical protein